MTEEVRDCFCTIPVSRTVQMREEGDEVVLVDKTVALTQAVLVRRYLNEKLSRVWDGWNDFNQRLSGVIDELAVPSDSQVAAVRLTTNELDEFIGTIVPAPWHRPKSGSTTYNVAQNVVCMMEDASRNASEKRQEREAQQCSEILSLRERVEQLELVKLFHPVRELLYEYSRPFVARAVEIDGIDDGVSYAVQGLGRDGKWMNIFSHQYHRNEIGLRAFNNDTEYAKYRLICMDDFSIGRARMKLYKTSEDGENEFQRGVPILTSADKRGYEIDSTPAYDGNWVGINAFNNKTDGFGWHSKQNPGTSWLQVKLPRRRIFNAVEIFPRGDCSVNNQAPKDFFTEGSNEGSVWVKLCEKRNVEWSFCHGQVFAFKNDKEFLFYRLAITSSRCDYHSLSIFNLGNTGVYCGDPISLSAH